MSDPIIVAREGAIATITLNRPEKRNPVTDTDVVEGIEAAVDALNGAAGVRVAIITGAGTAFSSGGDVKRMASKEGPAYRPPVETREWYLDGVQRIPKALHELRVPLIAAVNGPAIGAGCDLACMADIRIAAQSARFASSFVRLGIIPGDGGAYFLPRAIGLSRACEMMFAGEMIDADTALAWGLVSRVVPDDELMVAARDLAGRIAANPGHALRMAKRLVREAQHASLDTVLELSAALQSIAHTTPDHKEAVTAFVEKRPPKFSAT